MSVPSDPNPARDSGQPANEQRALQLPPGKAVAPYMVLPAAGLWHPPTDVYELPDRVVVVVEIAGVRDSRLDIRLADRRLVISGTRDPLPLNAIGVQQVEIRYGSFHTEVVLPFHADRDQISAVYRDGLLRVELPRAANKHVRVVDLDGL